MRIRSCNIYSTLSDSSIFRTAPEEVFCKTHPPMATVQAFHALSSPPWSNPEATWSTKQNHSLANNKLSPTLTYHLLPFLTSQTPPKPYSNSHPPREASQVIYSVMLEGPLFRSSFKSCLSQRLVCAPLSPVSERAECKALALR